MSQGNFYILLHSGRICHLGKRIMKQCFFPPSFFSLSGLFKAVLSLRHGNGWIGLNELSSLSVKVRIVEICGTFGFIIFFGKGLLDEDDQGPRWGGKSPLLTGESAMCILSYGLFLFQLKS